MKKKVLCLGIAIIMLFAAIGLVGCSPSGFLRGESHPLIFNGEQGTGIQNIAQQFPELNNFESFPSGRQYFLFDGKLHFIENRTAFREAIAIGQFIEISDDWDTNRRHFYVRGPMFLYGEHLYYYIEKVIVGFGFEHNLRRLYRRNEFFRFNLVSTTIEEISLTQYVNSLQNIDSNWAICPDYKGER